MILYNSEIISRYTNSGAWGETTLIEYFKQNIKQYGHQTCLVDPTNKEELVGLSPRRLSYHELDEQVEALAASLFSRGIRKDSIVVVQLPNIAELVIAYLAISLAGAIISPVPMQWRSKELRHVFKHTEANMFIGLDTFNGFSGIGMAHELQKELNLPQHIVSLAELAAMTTENATLEEYTGLKNMRPSANEVFTIQWTSGTEADAKGCPLTHNNQIFQGKCYQAHQRTRGRKSRIETPRRYRRCCSRNARRKTG